ncbi:MAG: hypothetical protein RR313_10950 [Anaerovoracaceae bacterium]
MFAACGGSGVGDDGWALDNPVGHTFLFDNGNEVGLVLVVPTSKSTARWMAPSMLGNVDFMGEDMSNVNLAGSGMQCTYHKTGANTCTYVLSGVYSPTMPTTSYYGYTAKVTLSGQNSKTKEIIGTTEWSSNVTRANGGHVNKSGTGTVKISKKADI